MVSGSALQLETCYDIVALPYLFVFVKLSIRQNGSFSCSCGTLLQHVQKNDVITMKNLHIVTRQGTKTGADNPRISKIKEKNDYPDPLKEKQTYKEATNVFK